MDDIPSDVYERLERLFKDTRCRELAELPAVMRDWPIQAFDNIEAPRQCILAPSYGHLRKRGLKLVDESLEAFVRDSIIALEDAVKEGRPLTWTTVDQTFMQSPSMMLDPLKSRDEHCEPFLQTRSEWSLRKTRSETDQDIVQELKAWLNNLINNSDIIESTAIPIAKLSNFVARRGPLRFKEFRVERVQRTFVDVGIIRYPKYEDPSICIYRIQLFAWASCKRNGLFLESRSGIQGHFIERHYKPRKEFIQRKLEIANAMALEDETNGSQTQARLWPTVASTAQCLSSLYDSSRHFLFKL